MLELGTGATGTTSTGTAGGGSPKGAADGAGHPAPAGHPALGEGDAVEPCDLVTVPARQGLEAMDILRRGAPQDSVGPVVHDCSRDTLGFLVPPGTAAAWDVPGSACTRTNGRGLRLPAEPPAAADGTPSSWLLPPGENSGEAPVTDPAALRDALGEAARLIEAADGCR
ncbi:hypothetical protein [Streptomyces sp. NPDC050504]|uniref:hypothetical protein n=1 Tax=Streptomyces sp. NPDC050504 TaxID=3365618 RepID=UPI0037890631